jgi:NAD(P)H-dependent FMN reductase
MQVFWSALSMMSALLSSSFWPILEKILLLRGACSSDMVSTNNGQPRSVVCVQGCLKEYAPTDILLTETKRILANRHILHSDVDVRSRALDFYDGRPLEKYSEETQESIAKMEQASAYIFSIPVYAAKLSGAVKNIITLSYPGMQKKAAGILAYSSSVPAYPAVHELIGILSQSASVVTVQPVVYASSEEFRGGKIFDDQISLLIEEMIDALLKRMIARDISISR